MQFRLLKWFWDFKINGLYCLGIMVDIIELDARLGNAPTGMHVTAEN